MLYTECDLASKGGKPWVESHGEGIRWNSGEGRILDFDSRLDKEYRAIG